MIDNQEAKLAFSTEHLLIVMLLGVGTIVIGELVSVSALFSAEISRKIFHLLACLLIGSFVFFDLDIWATIIILLSFVLVQLLLRRYRPLTVLSNVQRESYGEFHLLLAGIVAMALANSWQAYFIAFLILAMCDSLAAIVGQNTYVPNVVSFRNGKTLKGSGAFFACCVLLVATCNSLFGIGLDSQMLLYVLTMSAALATLELFISKGLDNFVIPVLAVVLLDRIYA